MLPTNFPVTRGVRPKPFSLTLEVTQDFIDKGVKDNVCDCAIALAIKAKLPKGYEECARVTLERVEVVVPGFNDQLRPKRRAEVPPEMESFIRDFDDGKTVWPRSFDLHFRPVY